MVFSFVFVYGNGRFLNIRIICFYLSSVIFFGFVLVSERIEWVIFKVCDYFVIVEIIEIVGFFFFVVVSFGELCFLMFFVDEEGGMNVRE